MKNNINYNSSIDTIILTQNVNGQTYNKARNFKSADIDPYICKRSGSDYKKSLGLEFRHKEHDLNFLHIEIKKLPHRATDYLKVTIHLNHFIYQAYPNTSYVKSEQITKDIEWIISKYLRFPGFNLDVMNVSSIDIAMDFLVNEDPSYYLNIIKNKEIPRYLLHYNNGNSTLSIHSYSLTESINSDEETPNKGTIYNKSGKMGLEKNILRFEFRLEGNQKNQLPLYTYNEQDYLDIFSQEKGVTKFSDIFCADIGVQLRKRFIDGVILKDSTDYETTQSQKNYIKKHRDWMDRFAGADDYYRKLAPLLKERKDINGFIKEICEYRAKTRIEEDQDRETLQELWTLIEGNLKEKFIYQLYELDAPVEESLSILKGCFLEMSINNFMVAVRENIPKKRKGRVDQADESTFKVIFNYFKKVVNNDEGVKKWKLDARRDITNRINSLRNEFKTYNKFMFLLHLYNDFGGKTGQELYDELKTLAVSYSYLPSEKVFNLYKYYNES